MTEAEGQYRYRDNEHAKARFLSRFQRILDLHYSQRYPAPDAVIDEAWEMLALGRTEREVVLAIDWLREGYDRQKPVKTMRAAREHAYAVVSKEPLDPNLGQASGQVVKFAGGPLSDHPGLSDRDRAILAYTRHYLLARRDLKLGDPGCAEQHRAALAGMRDDDPRWVAEWAEIARIDEQARPKSEARIRREVMEAADA